MAGVFIEQEGYMPSTVMFVDETKKLLEIHTFVMTARKQQAMPRVQIQRAKDYAPCISTGQHDASWFPASRPTSTQRRK